MKTRMSCKCFDFVQVRIPNAVANSTRRYDLKQMLMKSSISRVPEELRKHEAAQQKSQKGGGQKKIEDSSGFAGKGGWQ